MAAMALWAAVLITYGVSTGIAMHSAGAGSNTVIQLDKATNSIDDMYDGCKDKMKTKVEAEYLQNDINTNSRFKDAWEEAEKTYNKKWKKTVPRLGKEQIKAIYVYSFGKGDIYKDINNAIRTQRSQYGTTFGYHALYFFLTDALQTLNTRKAAEDRCVTGYRGVDLYFSQDVLNKEIRFGSFTSTSMRGYNIAKKFGDKSCFEIYTCFGADISMFSKFGEAEAEVLIPPYEVFKVTKIEKKSEKQTLECDVVYILKSAGTLSDKNCALFPKKAR